MFLYFIYLDSCDNVDDSYNRTTASITNVRLIRVMISIIRKTSSSDDNDNMNIDVNIYSNDSNDKNCHLQNFNNITIIFILTSVFLLIRRNCGKNLRVSTFSRLPFSLIESTQEGHVMFI